MAFKLGMMVDMHGIWWYAHARVDDLDLDAGHSASAKAKNQQWMISTTKQAMKSIKLATTTEGHFLCDRDFENVYMAWPSCFFLPLLKGLKWIPPHPPMTHKVQLWLKKKKKANMLKFLSDVFWLTVTVTVCHTENSPPESLDTCSVKTWNH